MTPMRISDLITSAPRSAMRLASSWIVIVSGTTTSRTIFVCSRRSMRWRSRSRARRTEARLRVRSPPSSSRARVTVSLPRRRWSSARRTGAAGRFKSGRRPGRAAAGASSSSSTAGAAILPAAVSAATLAAAALPARSATSRRDSSSLRRASSSAVRRFASSSARVRASSSSGLRRASSSARSRASSAARSSSWRRRSASASAARRRASSSALRASCRTRTRVACSSAVSVRAVPAGRAVGRLPVADGAAGCARAAGWARATGRRRRLAAAGFRRAGRARRASCEPRPSPPSSGHARSSGAPGRSRPVGAAPSVPPERSVKGRFCSCSLASCSFASVMRFGTVLLSAPDLAGCNSSSTAAGPSRRERQRAARPASRDRAAAAGTVSRRPRRRARSGRGRTPRQARPRSAPSAHGRSRASSASLSPPALGAVPGAQQQRGPPVPYRLADPVEPGNGQPGPAAKPERVDNSAAPAEFRADPQDPAAPIPAAAPRAQRAASPPRVPLYRGAASTTNPVRGAARRYRARPSRRDRRQSAAAGRDRAPRRWRCSGAAATRQSRRLMPPQLAAAACST